MDFYGWTLHVEISELPECNVHERFRHIAVTQAASPEPDKSIMSRQIVSDAVALPPPPPRTLSTFSAVAII